ncbi:DUF4157 domain-containing protein [Streptomyces sp. NPDC057552]|uniref:eCIS core domain-containing protein n=1 Tax=Streptomyces sp. NPDC057552 TaxID=3350537 RepID=UPI0036BEF051
MPTATKEASVPDHAHAGSNVKADSGPAARRSATVPPAATRGPLPGLLALQPSVGNAVIVQRMLRAREEHRHGAGCGHPADEVPVQRSTVHDVLRTNGRPLDGSTRADMESRLGADFSDVRIHDDSTARASAAEVGARAYTAGHHVVIGEGGADRHTLAHELTHVIQQRQGPVAGTDNGAGLRVSDPSDRFEREAESNARRAMSGAAPKDRQGERSEAGPSGQPAVQRWADQASSLGQGMRVSAGGVFATVHGGTSVWIRVGTPNASFSPALRPTTTAPQNLFGTGDYQEYELARQILDDCLHTAEEIMHNAVGELGDGANSSIRTNTGTKAFGVSDESNRERAAAFQGNANRDAAPAVGQAYVMVALNPGDTVMSQYHAAAVVGLDGTDTITLEAFAGSNQTTPDSGTYTISTAESFHDTWTDGYYSRNYPHVTMKTVVLSSRGQGRRVAPGNERPVNPNVA